ncbi:Conserved_hypothetical protein [Hexamita inflata]|uniref:Uncharacterized protein n=1 Tax=Hexamita inflata TaxID=28002 RepID=A0ABP1H489_9EUKA
MTKLQKNTDFVEFMRYFTPREEFVYFYTTYTLAMNSALCVDIIDCRSLIYNEYCELMLRRIRLYPNIKYLLLTSNTKTQVIRFLQRYPKLSAFVNVAQYTKQMQQIITTYQIPFTFILNEHNQIVYKGPIQTEFYHNLISHLNERARFLETQLVKFMNVKQDELQNRQLGLALSGINKTPVTIKYQKPIGMFDDGMITEKVVRSGSAYVKKRPYSHLGESSRPLMNQLDELRLPYNIKRNADEKERIDQQLDIPRITKEVILARNRAHAEFGGDSSSDEDMMM